MVVYKINLLKYEREFKIGLLFCFIINDSLDSRRSFSFNLL